MKKTKHKSPEELARELFDQFIALHPNSREMFEPNLANMQRWQWHIQQAVNRPVMESVTIKDDEQARAVARSRSFSQFLRMPAYMQARYLQIAGLFPDVQFYACGSRVTGEYIEAWSGPAIQKLRARLGKPEKAESDYDVCVVIPKKSADKISGLKNIKVVEDIHPRIANDVSISKIREALPSWADLLTGVPDNEKILIPMWDFTRLPKSEHARAIRLYKEQDWGELMKMHNDYVLSMHVYCCDEGPIIRFFGWAIEKGKITNDEEPEKKVDAVAE